MYDVTHESKLDAAISRGFDPHDEHADVPGPPLDEKWQAALDASVAQVKALRGTDANRAEFDEAREIDRLLAQDLADRDREWWSE